MVMVPDRYKTFISYTKELVNEGQISISRIDDAVKRILKQKILLGLLVVMQEKKQILEDSYLD